MDYWTLDRLRQTHAGWRLLAADHSAFVASFLHSSFIAPNVRTRPQGELVGLLEDHLFTLRERKGEERFPRSPGEYLDEWASERHGWLRKYYPPQGDEPHFDLTSMAERAIEWLSGLRGKPFVGTESRLLTVFNLLQEIVEGTESDSGRRLAELEKKRSALDEEIARVREGLIDMLDSTKVKDRFLQVEATARGLLADFREVEQNFRDLDRGVRERIAAWEGSRGALLDEIFGEHDSITSSDQGRSFGAFWDFLMSEDRQEELSYLLDKTFALEAVRALSPDPKLRRVHHDWLHAGSTAQKTVARLSEQLRRLVDEKAFLENRRIMQLLRSIETHARSVRLAPPQDPFLEIDDSAPEIELPLDRPLFSPPFKVRLISKLLQEGTSDDQTNTLFDQVFVDRARLLQQIRRLLQTRLQISLSDVVAIHPLEQGLAEVIAYLTLAAEDPRASIDETHAETLVWADSNGASRQATLPLVVFGR
jgi:hypothetical protein